MGVKKPPPLSPSLFPLFPDPPSDPHVLRVLQQGRHRCQSTAARQLRVRPDAAGSVLDTAKYSGVNQVEYECKPLDNGSGLHTCTLRGGKPDAKPLHVPATGGHGEMFMKFGADVACDVSWCTRKIETNDGKCYCGDGQMGSVVDHLAIAGKVANESCMSASEPAASCYKVSKATAAEYKAATFSDAARGYIM